MKLNRNQLKQNALFLSACKGRRRNSLGGGIGGGGGGGAGGLRKSKKYLQSFIPLFLAANAVGWLMLAVKAVAVLTVKALLVSKLAILVAGTIVFKKLMDSATEKYERLNFPFFKSNFYFDLYDALFSLCNSSQTPFVDGTDSIMANMVSLDCHTTWNTLCPVTIITQPLN